MGFSKQEYWSGLPFPSPVDHIVSDLSTTPARLGWPHTAWLSFIELDKAVVLVWLDWLVFCDCGFSVSALWCPFVTPTILLGLSYLGRGVSLHGCSSKAQPLLLTLDKGYLLTADLERGVAPLGPPAPVQPPLLGCGVAPLGRHPMIEARSDAVKSNNAMGPGILGPGIKENWKWSNRRWQE